MDLHSDASLTQSPSPDDPSCLALTGELNIFNVQWLKPHLLTTLMQHSQMTLSLAGITEMDGAGLQLLAAIKIEANRRDKSLRLADHSLCVIRVLELCELEAFFGDPIVISPVEMSDGI